MIAHVTMMAAPSANAAVEANFTPTSYSPPQLSKKRRNAINFTQSKVEGQGDANFDAVSPPA